MTENLWNTWKNPKTADQFLKRLKTIETHGKKPKTADQFLKRLKTYENHGNRLFKTEKRRPISKTTENHRKKPKNANQFLKRPKTFENHGFRLFAAEKNPKTATDLRNHPAKVSKRQTANLTDFEKTKFKTQKIKAEFEKHFCKSRISKRKN